MFLHARLTSVSAYRSRELIRCTIYEVLSICPSQIDFRLKVTISFRYFSIAIQGYKR